MASIINEQIITGRKFRKLIDETSRLWLRISFWTKACDVEFDDGETAETKFSNMVKTINDLKKSFQDGVNKIYNFLKGLGFTPSPNSPDGICGAIQNVYDKRYTDGRTQGRDDVKTNPTAYGVSTAPKYFAALGGDYDGTIYQCPADGYYSIDAQFRFINDLGHNAVSSSWDIRINGDSVWGYHLGCDGERSWGSKISNMYMSAGTVISVTVSKGGEHYAEQDKGGYFAHNVLAVCIY